MDQLLAQHNIPLVIGAAGVFLLFCALCLSLLLALRLRDCRRMAQQEHVLHEQYRQKNESLEDELNRERIHCARLVTLLESERQSGLEKLKILESARDSLRLQFQALAQRIFEEKSEKFGSENKERLTALLQPLQEQLRTFQKRMDDIQANDIRERSSLKEEIVHLRELNQQINKEAVNLTRALRGDTRMQGNWGELVLERLLERSGLRKGEEYSVQTGYRDADNRLFKPDVIIHLPDRKDIIIDSKVSLLAWEKYVNCDNDRDKASFLKEHLLSIRRHITELSQKNYAALSGLHSLDFVLLFVPIDSSFVVASAHDENLFADAYEQHIIIVTPTTLLATLKTVENLWRFERQSDNAREIAERAGLIYDKLCGFLEEMDKIGRQLATCHATYDSAMNKLTRGRGNVLAQAGRLSELGIKAKKKLPAALADPSAPDLPN